MSDEQYKTLGQQEIEEIQHITEQLSEENAGNIVMPGQSGNIDTTNTLATRNVEEDLMSDNIGNVLIDKEDGTEAPSYLLDFRNEPITKVLADMLKGQIAEHKGTVDRRGNVYDRAVYLWWKNTAGTEVLTRLGYGNEYQLYYVLETVIQDLYSETVKVYKNTSDNPSYKEATLLDVSSTILYI